MTNEQKYKIENGMVVPVKVMEEPYKYDFEVKYGRFQDKWKEPYEKDLEAYRTYISSLPSPVQASKELQEQMGDREFTGEEYEVRIDVTTKPIHTLHGVGECFTSKRTAYPITKQGESISYDDMLVIGEVLAFMQGYKGSCVNNDWSEYDEELLQKLYNLFMKYSKS